MSAEQQARDPLVTSDAVQQRIAAINADPGAFVAQRRASVAYHLGRLRPKRARHAGNVTMYEHLVEVQRRLEQDPDSEVQAELGRLETRLAVTRETEARLEADGRRNLVN